MSLHADAAGNVTYSSTLAAPPASAERMSQHAATASFGGSTSANIGLKQSPHRYNTRHVARPMLLDVPSSASCRTEESLKIPADAMSAAARSIVFKHGSNRGRR